MSKRILCPREFSIPARRGVPTIFLQKGFQIHCPLLHLVPESQYYWHCIAEHAVCALISSPLVANVHFPVHDDGLYAYSPSSQHRYLLSPAIQEFTIVFDISYSMLNKKNICEVSYFRCGFLNFNLLSVGYYCGDNR